MKKLLKSREMALFLLELVLVIVITSRNPAFLSAVNLINIIKGNVILAICSVGMLLVMISGGIDASIGGTISAVMLLVGNFMIAVTGNVVVAFLLGALLGILIGVANGLLIAYIKIPPLVATLGVYSIVRGLILFITRGAYLNNIPHEFTDFGTITFLNIFRTADGQKLGLPIQFLILILLIVLTWFLMRRTKIGRGVFAVGNNVTSAERIGFNVKRILIFVYAYMGFVCGIAGITHISIMKKVDPNAYNGYEMKVIAAVILGGVNVMGGEGSLTGTMLGVLVFATINNGLTLMKVSTYWQNIILGAVMVIAICVVVMQKARLQKNRNRVDIEAEASEE